MFVQSSRTGSVKDSKTQHAIKKHVMRDIGKARRIYDVEDDDDDEGGYSGEPAAKAETSDPATLTLPTRPSPKVHPSDQAPRPSGAASRSEYFEDIALAATPGNSEAPQPLFQAQGKITPRSSSWNLISHLPQPATLLDASRRDPFAAYPIQTSPSVQRLISDSKSPPILSS